MDEERLLTELETLTHAARAQRMVALGRTEETEPGTAALLDALERGRFYPRRLALQSCYGSRNGARVLRILSDPSRELRGMALKLVAYVCDDAQTQTALETILPAERKRLLRWLYKRRRTVPVDAYLSRLAAQDDPALPSLLPFGSEAFARRFLLQTASRMDLHDWQRLTRLQPDLAAETLQQQARTTTQFDPRLLWQANAVLPLLSAKRPEQALALVKALLPSFSLSQLLLNHLALRLPGEVAALLLASDDRANVRLDTRVDNLDTEALARLIERGLAQAGLSPAAWTNRLRNHHVLTGHTAQAFYPADWLERLRPEQRAPLYARFARGWQNAEGVISTDVVALLPRSEREAEARRHLLLPALQTRPNVRLPYVAFLPWEEALALLQPFLQNPDADLRGVAHQALAGSVRYQRARLPEYLALLHARRNEQDPVRLAMLTGLAELPPGMFREEPLEALAEIVQDTLDASDLSFATGRALEQRLVTLLRFHPGWTAAQFAKVLRALGQVGFGSLEQQLTDADVRRIAPEVLPVLEAWETREREEHLVAFARALGKRLRVFPALADILERVLRDTRRAHVADSILSLLMEHRRDRAAVLVPDLLQQDPSWITRPAVYTYLHARRQDLLTPFLGRHAYSGRFSTGKTRFVLPVMTGFHRWTTTQQETFARTLEEVAEDTERDNYGVFTAIQRLAALPDVAPTALARLARLQNPLRFAARDSALRALGKMDAGQGVPILLEALEDDRARLAIYALRSAVLEMPTDRALALLSGVPVEKVTVAKEIVRLLGDLKTTGAYQQLLAMDSENLHRDVRVALLRALWEHLEQPETWPILERAAASPDAALTTMAGRTPADRLSAASQRRLIALLAGLLAHPDPKVRLDVLNRCVQLPVADADRSLLPRLLESLGSSLPDESAAAARAVFVTYTGEDAPVVGQAMERLLGNRRALHTAVHTLLGFVGRQRSRMLPMVRATLAALASDPLTSSLQVELAIQALPWEEVGNLLTRLAGTHDLHADALVVAEQALLHSAARTDVAELEALERALSASPDRYLRRLGLAALVTLAQPPRGWDTEGRERLEAYRNDSAGLVAAAAQFTFPPEEPQGSQGAPPAAG